MYERSYGYKYEEAADKYGAELAKLIRADIKQAIGEGLLPAKWKYSVQTRHGSMMQAIDVTVKGCADAWKPCDRRTCADPWCKSGGMHRELEGAKDHEILTDEADAARMTLERIHSAYNHDGSEIQTDYFDVRYYGQVHVQDARSATFEAAEKARKAAKKQAIEAATDVKVVRVYGRQKSTTHYAAEIDGKVRLVCGAQLWRSSVVSLVPDGTAVTCSRCAKKDTGAK